MGKIVWADIEAKAREAVLRQVGEAIPGEAKADAAIDEVVKWADKELRWSFLGPVGIAIEAVDGPVIRAILRLVVQHAYDELKAEGAVDVTGR